MIRFRASLPREASEAVVRTYMRGDEEKMRVGKVSINGTLAILFLRTIFISNSHSELAVVRDTYILYTSQHL